ncbi:MAG: bile acid:sodium symporter family protein [Paludibacter sp.]|nr:bile acid:sodium symporter family protein [Paludibacter sp.]
MKWKNFSFTIIILVAVAISMTFPQYFTQWGSYELKNAIVPLLQLITFGVGCSMHVGDFKNLLKMPKGVLIGVACQYTIMPLVGFSIAAIFNFPPEIAAGVILIGCSPSGMASNVMALISKGNLALSVTITTFATLLAPVMTPLLMQLLGGTYIEVSFWGMLWDITKILIIPIFLGMAMHYLFISKIDRLIRLMPKISMAGIAFIIVVITAAGRDSLLVVGFALILAMFLHMTVGFSLGYFVARLLRLSERDCRTIALEVGMQNGGLASGIAASMGKIATLGLAPAVNGPLMNTVFSVIATWWAGKKIKDQTDYDSFIEK